MSITRKKIIYGALIATAVALLGWLSWNAYIDHLTAKESERVELLIKLAKPAPMPNRLDHEQLITDINWLAHEERAGRAPGTPGGLAARAYIQERFAQLGLEPGAADGYLHKFQIPKSKCLNAPVNPPSAASSSEVWSSPPSAWW